MKYTLLVVAAFEPLGVEPGEVITLDSRAPAWAFIDGPCPRWRPADYTGMVAGMGADCLIPLSGRESDLIHRPAYRAA